MRPIRVFSAATAGLVALVAASANQAAPLPERGAPQLSKTAQQRYDWCRANLVDAYQRHGDKDPKWDEAVGQALASAVEGFSKKPGRPRNEVIVVDQAYRKAVRAGCKEPLLSYAYASLGTYKAFPRTVAGMKKSAYHPFWRCDCLVQTAHAKLILPAEQSKNEEARKEAQAFWTEAMELLPAVFQDREIPRELALNLLGTLGEVGILLGHDRKVVWEATSSALGKERADSGFALCAEGHFWRHYAWDGRTAQLAAQVTEDQWKLFRERLEKGAEVLEKAWEREPHVEVALDRMGIALGQNAPLQVLDTWFDRAVREAPDDYRPYGAKLYHLEPKWHGSAEEMLKFAREVSDANHWSGHYRLLADAHWILSGYANTRDDYFQTPGAWDEVKSVYDRFLQKYPEASQDRSRFIQMAVWSGQWEEADRQFRALNTVRSSYFIGGVQGIHQMRALIESKLKQE